MFLFGIFWFEVLDLQKIFKDCEKAQNWLETKKHLLKDKLTGLQILYQNVSDYMIIFLNGAFLVVQFIYLFSKNLEIIL